MVTLSQVIHAASNTPSTTNVEVLTAILQQCERKYSPTNLEPWKVCLKEVHDGLPNAASYTVDDWAESMEVVWNSHGLNAATLSRGLMALDAFSEESIIRAAEAQSPTDLVITLRVATDLVLQNLPKSGYQLAGAYVKLMSDSSGTSTGEGTNELDNEGLTPGQHIAWIAEPDNDDTIDLTRFVPNRGLVGNLINEPTKVSPRIWQTTVLDKPARNVSYAYHFEFTLAESSATYWFDPFLGDTKSSR